MYICIFLLLKSDINDVFPWNSAYYRGLSLAFSPWQSFIFVLWVGGSSVWCCKQEACQITNFMLSAYSELECLIKWKPSLRTVALSSWPGVTACSADSKWCNPPNPEAVLNIQKTSCAFAEIDDRFTPFNFPFFKLFPIRSNSCFILTSQHICKLNALFSPKYA